MGSFTQKWEKDKVTKKHPFNIKTVMKNMYIN